MQPSPLISTAQLFGCMTAASAGDVSIQQIASEPLLRPAAILENVPGLIVTQHSGEELPHAACRRTIGK